MRIVFFGTPVFAKKILEALIANQINIIGIVTQPDRPKGRALIFQPPPVKELYLEKKLTIPLFQPDKVSTLEVGEILKNLRPDLFLVVGYGEILKDFILSIPTIDCINIHTSLLPTYRGAAPIQRAILAGETRLGITIMKMVKKMDAGDVFLQESLNFNENQYFDEIEHALCELAIKMIIPFLKDIRRYLAQGMVQNEALVSFAPKIENSDLIINWHHSSKEIINQIRAFSPQPAAYCKIKIKGDEKQLKIIKAKSHKGNYAPCQLIAISKNQTIIGCFTGAIEPLIVRPEGKNNMSFDAFLRGASEVVFL
ncbi:MAG: methionyl-tRNA formyltransferase [Chlamydiales bacterium]|nr:methionyl-tRNA formyltransferase [Chlamydiales bacterium]